MRIYDITQELFSCAVFPGDPVPQRELRLSIEEGAVCNLSVLSMCAHNGTHVDAPYHFYNEGKTIEQLEPDKFIGWAYVAEQEGEIGAEDAARILEAARSRDPRAAERILVKGRAFLSLEGARVFAAAGIKLFGNESQTVGPENAPRAVHLVMLGAEIVLLEGIRLRDVPEGVYLLHAAPLKLGGADGAPCRATLLETL